MLLFFTLAKSISWAAWRPRIVPLATWTSCHPASFLLIVPSSHCPNSAVTNAQRRTTVKRRSRRSSRLRYLSYQRFHALVLETPWQSDGLFFYWKFLPAELGVQWRPSSFVPRNLKWMGFCFLLSVHLLTVVCSKTIYIFPGFMRFKLAMLTHSHLVFYFPFSLCHWKKPLPI